MANRSLILLFLIIALAIPLAGADLSSPSTWHAGQKIWGTFWDMWGENGVRNGTIGGVGNNVTFLDSNGVQFLSRSGTTVDLDMNNKNITNVKIITSTEVNVTTFNATSIRGNGSGIFALNAFNLTNTIADARLSGNVLLGSNTTVRPEVNTSLNLKLNKTDVDTCTGASDALGWNGTGFPCKTLNPKIIVEHNYSIVQGNTSGSTQRLQKSIGIGNGTFTLTNIKFEACKNIDPGNVSFYRNGVDYIISQPTSTECNSYLTYSLTTSFTLNSADTIDMYVNSTTAGADNTRTRGMNISYFKQVVIEPAVTLSNYK